MDRFLSEPIGIDPRVDIVFQHLFADPAREALRIDFLSAVLGLQLTEATVESPLNLATFADARTVVVDVRAKDDQGRALHIEMQRRADAGLPQRMLYSWARLYAHQL
jgi:predicted transposase/invertase (TIGR01784 family)